MLTENVENPEEQGLPTATAEASLRAMTFQAALAANHLGQSNGSGKRDTH